MARSGEYLACLILAATLCISGASWGEGLDDVDGSIWDKLRAEIPGLSAMTGNDDIVVDAAEAGHDVGVPAMDFQPANLEENTKTSDGDSQASADLGEIVLQKIILPKQALQSFRANVQTSKAAKEEKENGITDENRVCGLQMDRGRCRGYFNKYSYDKAKGECSLFVYGGCNGNDNRFNTKEDCEARCSSYSKPANKTKTISNICQLPKVSGPCTGPFRQYYFYAYTSKCDLVFGGCLAGGNSFNTLVQCENTCLPESERSPTLPPGYSGFIGENTNSNGAKVNVSVAVVMAPTNTNCSLPKAPGLCYGYFLRYFYNIETARCESFVYGGCPGNANRFRSMSECRQACMAKRETDIIDVVIGDKNDSQDNKKNASAMVKSTQYVCAPPVIDLPASSCLRSFIKYFLNSTTGQCEPIHGACNGYGDLFDSRIKCTRKCLPSTNSPSATMSPSIVGVTLPGSNACALGKDSGPCRGSIRKFFFDKDTGLCQEFLYGGCRGNDNRFDSIYQCLETCRDQIQVKLNQMDDICELDKDSGPCFASFNQYYYNKSAKKCERFTYGGCRGNANRFDTAEQCKQRCGQKMDMQSIENSTDISTVTEADVCLLTLDRGPCRASFKKYFFNRESKRCEEFVYGGCAGNANRFKTMQDCETKCNPEPVFIDVCALNADPGPCKAAFTYYFFNPISGKCEMFLYGGCRGNGNRFATKAMCEMICAQTESEEPTTELPRQSMTTKSMDARTVSTPPSVPAACLMNKDKGPCRGAIKRFFFNQESGECEEFLYGGCRGNMNKYSTKEACETTCASKPTNTTTEGTNPEPEPDMNTTSASDTLPKMCSLNPVSGPCRAAFTRYYFDPETRKCEMFRYGGCRGNDNNFSTLESCQMTCMATSGNDTDAEVPSPEPVSQSTSSPYNSTVSGGPADNMTTASMENESKANQTTDPMMAYNSTDIMDVMNSTHMMMNITKSMPKIDRCSMRKEHGPCFGLFKQFYFDKTRGKCRKFMYGGCKGNDNRFDTPTECEVACMPMLAADDRLIRRMDDGNTTESPMTKTRDVCLLPRRSGPCYGNMERYFYNNESNKCEMFSYGGCQGNDNRFETFEECDSRCVIIPTAPPCVKPSNCPVCMSEVPKKIFPTFCASTNAYKSSVRKLSTESWPIKILADLRPKQKVPFGVFTQYTVPEQCECPTLENIGSKVLILVGHNAKLLQLPDSKARALIYLNNDVTVLPLTADLERTIFKGHKTDECDFVTSNES